MGVNHAVNLNLSAAGVPPVLHMAQYDANSRTIVATLWDGTSGFTIPTGASVMVRFGKPDGTGGLYDETEAGDAITYSGNVVTAPVASQMLSVAGKVQANIEIYQTGETAQAAVKLATFCFVVNVEKAAYQDAEIISSDYYNVVAGQIQQAVAAATAAENNKNAAATSATRAQQSATNANSAKNGAVTAKTAAQTAQSAAEAWAVGKRNGVDVGEDDPAYHNNAKYYSQQPKSTAVNCTLPAASWSNGAQTVSVTGITATTNGFLRIAQNATNDEFKAWCAAQLRVTAQTAGSITVTSTGTVPSINIPVEVLIV